MSSAPFKPHSCRQKAIDGDVGGDDDYGDSDDGDDSGDGDGVDSHPEHVIIVAE